jgi:hypothetical protein
MRYRSKIDWWIGALLILAPFLPAVTAFFAHSLLPLVGSAFILALYGLLFPIWYETSEERLVIHAGLIKTKLPYSEIHSLRPSRSALSSPALSLDRLEISYGNGSRVLISPEDKAGFTDDIRARIPAGALMK